MCLLHAEKYTVIPPFENGKKYNTKFWHEACAARNELHRFRWTVLIIIARPVQGSALPYGYLSNSPPTSSSEENHTISTVLRLGPCAECRSPQPEGRGQHDEKTRPVSATSSCPPFSACALAGNRTSFPLAKTT